MYNICTLCTLLNLWGTYVYKLWDPFGRVQAATSASWFSKSRGRVTVNCLLQRLLVLCGGVWALVTGARSCSIWAQNKLSAIVFVTFSFFWQPLHVAQNGFALNWSRRQEAKGLKAAATFGPIKDKPSTWRQPGSQAARKEDPTYITDAHTHKHTVYMYVWYICLHMNFVI